MSGEQPPPALPHDAKLGLRPGFRLQYEPAQECDVLLFPEGMVKLSESAGEIMKRVDGTRNVDGIVAELERQFPGHDLRGDVIEFLTEAWNRGWLHAP